MMRPADAVDACFDRRDCIRFNLPVRPSTRRFACRLH